MNNKIIFSAHVGTIFQEIKNKVIPYSALTLKIRDDTIWYLTLHTSLSSLGIAHRVI